MYGVPEQWPHVHALLDRAGFAPGHRTEIVFLAEVDSLDRPAVPLPGVTVARTLGTNGVRFTAMLGATPSAPSRWTAATATRVVSYGTRGGQTSATSTWP